MASNDYTEAVDSSDVSMRLSDSLYNEGGIPEYLFLQGDDEGCEDIANSNSVPIYGVEQDKAMNGEFCNDSNIDLMSDITVSRSQCKRKSSISSNNSESRGSVRGKQDVTIEEDIPEEVTYTSGDSCIKYRYIADFCIYNNKLSRMIPLDSIKNNYESIYFSSKKSTLDYFVTYEGSNDRNSISELKTENNNDEFTMTGYLIPFNYILSYDKEKSTILRENYKKLLKARQKGGVSSGFKSKKVKEIPKSLLKQEAFNSFPITCRIHSWTIEFGSNIYDPPCIWINSIPLKGDQKTCYRLIWPANKYSKYYSAAKLKFDIITRLVKTLLSPNSNRIGYRTFLDQVTGKSQDKSPNKKQITSTETDGLNCTNEDNSDQVSAGSTVSGGTPANSTLKKTSKESISSSNDTNFSTAWGDPVCIPGSTEKDVLLMYKFIENYLKAYSERHNLSKTLGIQILVTMRNKLVKMISSEDSSLSESEISSNLDNYLENIDLMEKIFSCNKLQSKAIGLVVGNRNDLGGVNVSNGNNLKRRRSSVSKAEDALKNYLPKIKCYADSFDNCLGVLRMSFFLGVYGEYLDLPINSSSLLSIQSYYSRIFPENNSTCIEIIKCFYFEYKNIIERQRNKLKENGRKVIQEDLVEFISIVNLFPKNLFFSISSKMVSFISDKLLPSKLGLVPEETNSDNSFGSRQIKRAATSLLFNPDSSGMDIKAGDSLLSEFNSSLLNDIINKYYVDDVTWPIILGEIQKRLESISNYFEDFGEDDDDHGQDERNADENFQCKIDINRTKKENNEEEKIKSKNASCDYFENNAEAMFHKDSFLGVMSWMIDTLFSEKLGKEFMDQINAMQNTFVSSSAPGKKKTNVSLGRNDNLIGTDRYSNKYYIFNNTKTSNTLNKSLVIVPSCSESLNNEYLIHRSQCNNPICTKTAIDKSESPSLGIYAFENKRAYTAFENKVERKSWSCYRYLTRKKDLDTLMTCLNDEHYCEFQLKLKLRSIFSGKEFEHDQFNPNEYVKNRIKDKEQVIVPFGFNSIGIDMEKQYICFSLLSLFKQVSVMYMKMLFPLLVCIRNELETHFQIMDLLFKLSLTIFELFINGHGTTQTAFDTVIKELASLIKLISESILDCLSSFGIVFDKTREKNYKLWLQHFEGNVNMESHEKDGFGLLLGRKISVICLYLKIFAFKIIPKGILDMSFGRNCVSHFDFNGNSGYVNDRDAFISMLDNSNSGGKSQSRISRFIPRQSDALYYFRSGHLLVILEWINSIISERKGNCDDYVRFIEHFYEISENVSTIEKVKVENICYNFGDEQNGVEDEASLTPFVLLNCRLFPRKNETVPDDIESQLERLKENIDAADSLGRDFVSRKRTSNRIKNNNLSNSYREAIIADSTFTMAESRESFVRSNIKYIKKSRDDNGEYLNISLILPVRFNSKRSNGVPGPFGRSIITKSAIQKKSLEIHGFQPTTPFYLINDLLFRDSIERFLSRNGSRVSYFIGDKVYHGVIIRLTTDGDDIWDCILVENDDLKKNKERSIVCLNLWQIILD